MDETPKKPVTCPECESTDIQLLWQEAGSGCPEWQSGTCYECGHDWNESAR